MIIDEPNALVHYGTKRHSGRYPWGSGGDTSNRNGSTFLEDVDAARKLGLSDTEISDGMGLSTTEFRNLNSIATNERRAARTAQAVKLKATGMGASAIGREMGIGEGSVRALLSANNSLKFDRISATANVLRDSINKNTFVMVGTGIEYHLGVSGPTLSAAIKVLADEGYGVHYPKIDQLGTSHQTTLKIMSKPGIHTREIYNNWDKVTLPFAYSSDNGKNYTPLGKPESISSKRVQVIWKEDGGDQADGVIYVRPGVKDVSLGGKSYAQVRVVVDGTHYLKGMAFYKDDLPKGVDLAFNTNKSKRR